MVPKGAINVPNALMQKFINWMFIKQGVGVVSLQFFALWFMLSSHESFKLCVLTLLSLSTFAIIFMNTIIISAFMYETDWIQEFFF